MNELVLAGCRPEPLGSYLKALGVLRIVGEQRDRDAKGCWSGERFVLHTALSQDELVEFFLDQYEPTPIVAPWNNGSGFKEEKNPAAVAALRGVDESTSSRLEMYRDAIAIARALHAESVASAWPKEAVVESCRARLPDAALDWLDAAVVLADDSLAFPPLLGTGGNDGRFDFSVAYMQRLVEVIGTGGAGSEGLPERSGNWLRSALFGGPPVELVSVAIGQFHPGGAGGPNSSPLGSGRSLANPWDWVLLIEGSLLFASAASRRLAAGSRGRAAMPFCVDTAEVGFASSTGEEPTRGEVWAPIWANPASTSEVQNVLGEGRADWRGKPATRAVDLARATASLAVDRGIDVFARHVLVERNGRATVAVPIGRISVRERPGVSLTARLDPWWDRVRRAKDPPAAVARAMRRCDAAVFEHARVGTPAALLDVLAATADLESRLARSPRFRDEHARAAPVSGLAATEWLPLLDDGSAEFRLAAALASQHDGIGTPFLRLLLGPVATGNKGLDWAKGGAAVEGLLRRSLVDVLAGALIARARARAGQAANEDDGHVGPGVDISARYRVAAPVTDVASFVRGEVDDEHLAALLAALLLLDYRGQVEHRWPEHISDLGLVPPAWVILAPFFHGRLIRVAASEPVALRPELAWPAQLARDRVAPVVASALRRLRYARLDPAVANRARPEGGSGPRLAAAMLIPLSSPAAAATLRHVVPAPLG